ncbi:Xylose isomerase-like TIM barrel [Thalassoglobus neptunius]|uniref:Xylose isomerase-like TIM barrel n=1 Tax=Thalassoglobus neptunius TaxID=1938619 RepID=A0A5C5X523_9PLAN|nr:Xylose isomerase-like TIM barrel [Thalassoglobus neptunius]
MGAVHQEDSVFGRRISVATYEFGQDLRTSLHSAMQMRAQGVQFDLRTQVRAQDYGDTARRQLQNYLSERNLVAASAYFPLRASLFEVERLEERLNAVRAAMTFASKLRIRQMTLRIGRLPEADSKAYTDFVLPIMSDLAEHGNRDGVTICIIPSGDSSESLSQLLSNVKTGPLSIDGDIGGWILSRRNPQQQLRDLYQFIGQVDIRDAVSDVDGTGQEVPVGRGEAEWDEIAAILFEMEFAGWMNVRRTSGNDKIGDSNRAIQYLQNLMPLG